MKKIQLKALSFCIVFTLVLTLLPLPAGAVAEATPAIFPVTFTPEAEATAALLVELEDDTILYEKSATETRYPASITKIMTALLVIEAINQGPNEDGTGGLTLDQWITASPTCRNDLTEDSSTQNIQPGETLSVKDLLYCLLVSSANEAANILAEAVSGSVPAFVELMNQRAQELGMTNTRFANPHGLHRDDHYTTAYDIYLMTREAMQYPLFRQIVSTISYEILPVYSLEEPSLMLADSRYLFTSNALLSSRRYGGYVYSYCIGIKTGSTGEAGYCLVAAAERGDRTLISVVLGAENVAQANGSVQRLQFSESKRLLEWGFSAYRRTTVIDAVTLKREVPVKLSSGLPYVLVQPAQSIETTLPADLDADQIQTSITLRGNAVRAPVQAGDMLGVITATYNGEEIGSAELLAVNSVDRSLVLWIIDAIVSFFTSLPVRIVLILALALLLVRLIRHISLHGRRRTGQRPTPPPEGQSGPTKRPRHTRRGGPRRR